METSQDQTPQPDGEPGSNAGAGSDVKPVDGLAEASPVNPAPTPASEAHGPAETPGEGDGLSPGDPAPANEPEAERSEDPPGGQGGSASDEAAADPRIADLEAERDRLTADLAAARAVAETVDAHLADVRRLDGELSQARQEAQEARGLLDAALSDWGREKADAAILDALSDRSFVDADWAGAAAADFLAVVRPKIQPERNPDGSWVARGADGRTLADLVRLEAERRPWLFKPTSRGGSGTDGGHGKLPSPVHPGSFQAIASEFNARRSR